MASFGCDFSSSSSSSWRLSDYGSYRSMSSFLFSSSSSIASGTYSSSLERSSLLTYWASLASSIETCGESRERKSAGSSICWAWWCGGDLSSFFCGSLILIISYKMWGIHRLVDWLRLTRFVRQYYIYINDYFSCLSVNSQAIWMFCQAIMTFPYSELALILIGWKQTLFECAPLLYWRAEWIHRSLSCHHCSDLFRSLSHRTILLLILAHMQSNHLFLSCLSVHHCQNRKA